MIGGSGPADKVFNDTADELHEHTVEETNTERSWSEREVTHAAASRDLVSALVADVSRVGLLSREEEEALAQRIAAQRRRILKLLRSQRRLVSAALRGQGRGVVHPDEDFREREALRVLKCAKRIVRGNRRPEAQRLRAFARTLECEIATYRHLRDHMMTANVRLVMALARRYHHPTLSLLDLVQEGVFGLMRAVEKYEPSRQIKFSTYAVWWIWQQMARAADCQGAMIRTPVHWNQFRRKLRRNGDALAAEQRERWVAAHGLTPERATAMAQAFQCVSLAAPLRDGDDERTIADTLAADPEANPESSLVGADLTGRLALAVRGLPAREARIIELRFGLNGHRSCTLEEIGTQFGVSRERVRQLEARALKQMRVLCDAQGLAEFLH